MAQPPPLSNSAVGQIFPIYTREEHRRRLEIGQVVDLRRNLGLLLYDLIVSICQILSHSPCFAVAKFPLAHVSYNLETKLRETILQQLRQILSRYRVGCGCGAEFGLSAGNCAEYARSSHKRVVRTDIPSSFGVVSTIFSPLTLRMSFDPGFISTQCPLVLNVLTTTAVSTTDGLSSYVPIVRPYSAK